VKKDEIHLQLAGVAQGGDQEAKYDDHDNSLGHDGLLAIRHQGEEGGMLVGRQQHGDHDGSIIVRGGHGDNEGIIVRQQHAVDNHDGIMDLAQHSDHSN